MTYGMYEIYVKVLVKNTPVWVYRNDEGLLNIAFGENEGHMPLYDCVKGGEKINE